MTDPRPTVYIETYGCQMNVSDSELMLGRLTASGYQAVDSPDGADVILLNTCAIRDHAEQRAGEDGHRGRWAPVSTPTLCARAGG